MEVDSDAIFVSPIPGQTEQPIAASFEIYPSQPYSDQRLLAGAEPLDHGLQILGLVIFQIKVCPFQKRTRFMLQVVRKRGDKDVIVFIDQPMLVSITESETYAHPEVDVSLDDGRSV